MNNKNRIKLGSTIVVFIFLFTIFLCGCTSDDNSNDEVVHKEFLGIWIGKMNYSMYVLGGNMGFQNRSFENKSFENMSFENRSFENFNISANLTEIEFTEDMAYLKISTNNETFTVSNLYTIEADQLIFTRQLTGERPDGMQPPSDWDRPDWNPPSDQERPSDMNPPSDMQRPSAEKISYTYRFNEDYTVLYINDTPFEKL